MLFTSPSFTSGPLRQAPLCSQPKLQKGRGPCCCCGHSAVPSPPLWCPRVMLFTSPSFTGGAVVPPLDRPRQHSAALAPTQCYSTVPHSPAIHCAKRSSAPSPSYRRDPLLLRPQCCIVVAAVVPLRNAFHQPIIHRRSIAASAPLLPAKATEGAGALLLLRPQCCTVAAAVVPPRNAIHQSIIHRRSITASAPLLQPKLQKGWEPCCCCGHSAVPSPPLWCRTNGFAR